MDAQQLVASAQHVLLTHVRQMREGAIREASFFTELEEAVTWRHEVSQSSHPLQYLPALTCWAAHGDLHRTVPFIATWQVVRRAAKSFDDIEDGESQRSARAINVAVGTLTLAHHLLAWEHSISDMREIQEALGAHILQACSGQHDDLRYQAFPHTMKLDPQGWLAIAQNKSGKLLSWACWAGAHCASAPRETERALRTYGESVGVLLQLADDYCDFWGSRRKVDKPPVTSLPLVYGRYVAPSHIDAWGQEFPKSVLPDEAQMHRLGLLLEQLGAKRYMNVVAEQVQAQAKATLTDVKLNPDARKELESLVDRIWLGPHRLPV